MQNRKKLSVAVSAICMGAMTWQAYAQENTANQEPELEVIEVTSQKRTQRLLDVPVSVQALSGDMLENLGVLEFSDLVTVSPSLALQDNLTPWQRSIYIRGVGTTINAPTVESSVSTVLDGVVLARQGQFFTELADTERVEILRGPQSTLFGKNALAGVISVVTKKPNLVEAEGNIGFDYDEYGATRVKGFYGAPISDTLAYRISANYSDSGESHLENVNENGRSLDHVKGHLVRAKLLWEASDNVEVLFIADTSSSKGPGGVRIGRSGSDAANAASSIGATKEIVINEYNRRTNINGLNENDAKEYGFSAQVNWDLGDSELVSITAYRDWNIVSAVDIDSQGFTTPLISSPTIGTPLLIGDVLTDKSSDQFSQEIRLQSSTAGDFQYVVGAYIWSTGYQDLGQERRQFCFGGLIFPLGTPCEGLTPVVVQTPNGPYAEPIRVNLSRNSDETVDTEYYALFGQFDYSVNQDMIVTAGLRVQEDKFSWEKTQLGPLFDTDRPLAGYEGEGSVSNTEVTGKLGMQYQLSKNANVYASFSRGYKGPGAQLNAEFTEPLEPETVNAFEVGYKERLLDNTLDLNVAVFRQEVNNTQVSFFDVEESAFLSTNVGETRQQGIEIDSMYAASNNLVLTANLTYLDAEFLDYQTECYIGDPSADCVNSEAKDVSGEALPYSPKLKGIVGGRYTTELSFGNLEGFFQLNYRWQSETQYESNQNPLSLQESYGVADLSFGVEEASGLYKVNFYVKNLTDENHATNLQAFADAFGTRESVIQFIPKSADRYMGVNFEYNF